MSIWKEMVKSKYFPIYFERESLSPEFGRFCIQPLKSGQATLLESSLRSALMNLSGVAVAGVYFSFEPSQMNGQSRYLQVREELLFTIKKLRLSSAGAFPLFASLKRKGPCNLSASDFHFLVPVKLLIPNQALVHLAAGESISIDIILQFGKGSVSAQDVSDIKIPKGWLSLDRNHSPVNRVSTEILPISTGITHRNEQLVLDITTDGSMTPEDALRRAMNWIRPPMDTAVSA